jgi:hypothetical protein
MRANDRRPHRLVTVVLVVARTRGARRRSSITEIHGDTNERGGRQ